VAIAFRRLVAGAFLSIFVPVSLEVRIWKALRHGFPSLRILAYRSAHV
jgi:hypothetical protein